MVPRTLRKDIEAMLREYPRYKNDLRLIRDYAAAVQRSGGYSDVRPNKPGQGVPEQERVIMALERDREYVYLSAIIRILEKAFDSLTEDGRVIVERLYFSGEDPCPDEMCSLLGVSERTFWVMKKKVISSMVPAVVSARVLTVKLSGLQEGKRKRRR